MEALFENLTISPVFVEAVVGKNLTLPHKDFDEKKQRLAHGKRPNLSELGCYFSHLKAIEQFLDDEDDYALILEDDLSFDASIEFLIKESLKHKDHFDLLRLSGLHNGHPVHIVSLNDKHNLVCNLTRQTGSGAYLLNRYAAKQMLKQLKPMWLPYDHAFGREWTFGVKTLFINPLPILQNITPESHINATSDYKLPRFKRISVFFFRFYNEISRVIFRILQVIKLKIQSTIFE
jgi:glycosyl transferase family 25